MRNLINAEIMQQTMRLHQMGAKVQVINSKLCYVSFDIGGFNIQYVYNVNAKGNYFLERIKPYPLPLKEFESEQDVIDVIEIDIEQFRNALRSHNIEEFIEFSRMLNRTLREFEELFLNYNIPKDGLDSLINKSNEMYQDIDDLKGKSKKLIFKKDSINSQPENK